MTTVTKRQIAERIAAKTGHTQVAVKQVVQLLFEEISAELAQGNRLEFRDFGVFEVVERKARTGRNPKTGERVPVPAKRVVSFKMGKLMKEHVGETASEPQPASGFTSAPSQVDTRPREGTSSLGTR